MYGVVKGEILYAKLRRKFLNKEWITVKDLANIQGITPRAVRKAVNKNKYVTRLVDGSTGSKYEILIQSLNYDTQNLIDFEKSKNEIEKNREPNLRKTTIIPPHAKQIALARYDLVNLWVDYKKQSKNKTEAGKDFLRVYNEGKMYPIIFNIVGQVSIGTIYRWYKQIKTKDDYTLLIPNYDYGEKECNVNLTKEEEICFKSLLLSPNKINIGKATKLTKYILNKKGYESPSSERSFRRYAKLYQQKHYDEWVFAREGQKALRDKVQPYITRDITQLEVGDVLVADGHRLAVQCLNPFTGKPCRATLIGYLDWKSTALVGYEIMLEENTQAITSALRNAIINLGKIPKICYQDNGKAFRAKFFTGDFYESGINGLFNKLGITAVFAQPYNARAKVIERFFRELQDGFERLLPSFVGSNITDKPAYMKRNEKFHKECHNEFIPTIEQLTQMLDCYMEFHRSLECPNFKGKTIGEVFEEGKGNGVNINELDDLMLHTQIKTINRNGIRFLKADYFNEALYGLQSRVIIKYSLSDLTKIKVFTLKNEFICEAERLAPIHPMAEYLGNIKDQEELKFKIRQQKTLEKQTIKEIKKYFKTEHIKPLEWQNVPQIVTNVATFQKEQDFESNNDGRPAFESRYERYEWHLRNGFKNDADFVWFKKYELSDEYKQIYGEVINEN